MRYIAIYDAAQAIATKYGKKGPQLYDERLAPFLRAAQEYKQLSPADRKKYHAEYGVTVPKAKRLRSMGDSAKAVEKRTPDDRAELERKYEQAERETFAAEWLDSITRAVMRGKLRAFKPVTQAPGKPADAKEAYIFLVRDTDLDEWLEEAGSTYRVASSAAEVAPMDFTKRARRYVTEAYRALKAESGKEPIEMQIAEGAAQRMNAAKEKDKKGRERIFTADYMRRHVMNAQNTNGKGRTPAWERPKD